MRLKDYLRTVLISGKTGQGRPAKIIVLKGSLAHLEMRWMLNTGWHSVRKAKLVRGADEQVLQDVDPAGSGLTCPDLMRIETMPGTTLRCQPVLKHIFPK